MHRTLAIFAVVLSGVNASGQDAHGFGPVEPVELPNVIVTRQDGVRVPLREVFAGRRSAVQFIFIDCTTACPLLGSLFGKVNSVLRGGESQLVSISVNPEKDTPARIATWLSQFQATSQWVGLRIDAADLPLVQQAFKQESGPPSGHTLQIFLVDETARYIARTVELPAAALIADALRIRAAWNGRPARGVLAGSLSGRDVFEGRGGIVGMLGEDRLDAGASRCSGCHGRDGGGGGEGKNVVPALTRGALTAGRARRGGPSSGYTERSFCDGLRVGVDPSGVRYSDLMPRYQIDGRKCHALWQFLTESTGAK